MVALVGVKGWDLRHSSRGDHTYSDSGNGRSSGDSVSNHGVNVILSRHWIWTFKPITEVQITKHTHTHVTSLHTGYTDLTDHTDPTVQARRTGLIATIEDAHKQ